VPILIVFVLIGVSARVIAAVENASPPAAVLKVTVIGHQWWWEVLYPDYGIVTANEIHVPATADGKNATYLQLQSADVIHSFWLPQLSGKTDLIPNRTNFMWIDPREPGIYVGNCAEYCGTQHANMLLRVVGEDPKAFKEWTIDSRSGPLTIRRPLRAKQYSNLWPVLIVTISLVRAKPVRAPNSDLTSHT
jgi:cytochrome c oxidase subunit II